MIQKLKARIVEWFVRDVRALAEAADRQRAVADVNLKVALEKETAVEEQARALSRMDRRNHYSESLDNAYRRHDGRTA